MTKEEYREILTRWLIHKNNKWADAAKNSTGAAADAASFYASAYANVWGNVMDGAPERWAEAEKSKS